MINYADYEIIFETERVFQAIESEYGFESNSYM